MALALVLAVTYADPQFGGLGTGLGVPGHHGHGHHRPASGNRESDEGRDDDSGEDERPRGGRPRPGPAPAPPGPAGLFGVPNPVELAAETLEYGPKIRDLVEVVGVTLVEMGNLAVADDPDIGARIVNILQAEIAKANKVLADWTAKTAGVGTPGSRGKREVDDSGKVAYNEVGDILVDSNDKIATDKGQLSPQAQDKIDAAHLKGVSKCNADPCLNHKTIKNKAKGAQRQG